MTSPGVTWSQLDTVVSVHQVHVRAVADNKIGHNCIKKIEGVAHLPLTCLNLVSGGERACGDVDGC